MLEEAGRAILQAGGAWGALLIVVVIGAGMIIRYQQHQLTAARAECDKTRTELYEKRLDEARLVLSALERNTTGFAALGVSIEARTSAINELVKGFAALVQTSESDKLRFFERLNRQDEVADEIEELAKAIIEQIRNLITEIARSGGGGQGGGRGQGGRFQG